MKLIKILEQVLNEKLGVPDGILEAAEDLYENIIEKLKYKVNKNKIRYDDDDDEYVWDEDKPSKNNFYNKGDKFNLSFVDKNYKIDDLKIDKVNVNFKLESAFFGTYNIKKMSAPIGPNPTINVYLGVPNDWDYPNIVGFIKNNKTKFTASLSHELMHWFDFSKRKHYNVSILAKYDRGDIIRNDLKNIYPISDFLYLLYFTHSVENVVRSTEFASSLKSEKVTRKNFLEFLKNDVTYQTLNRAKDFSYEKLKDDLKNYIPKIDNRKLEIIGNKDYRLIGHHPKPWKFLTDEEKIDELLNYVRLLIKENAFDNYFAKRNILFTKYGIKKPIMGFLKSVGKFSSNDDFYKNEEKLINNIGDKMIRKISKLYDVVDDK